VSNFIHNHGDKILQHIFGCELVKIFVSEAEVKVLSSELFSIHKIKNITPRANATLSNELM